MSRCRKGTPNIPRADLTNLIELAKTKSLREIAKKWDVKHETIGKFLKRYGYGLNKIKKDYRMEFIKNNPRMTIEQLACGIECSIWIVRRLKKIVDAERAANARA